MFSSTFPGAQFEVANQGHLRLQKLLDGSSHVPHQPQLTVLNVLATNMMSIVGRRRAYLPRSRGR